MISRTVNKVRRFDVHFMFTLHGRLSSGALSVESGSRCDPNLRAKTFYETKSSKRLELSAINHDMGWWRIMKSKHGVSLNQKSIRGTLSKGRP